MEQGFDFKIPSKDTKESKSKIQRKLKIQSCMELDLVNEDIHTVFKMLYQHWKTYSDIHSTPTYCMQHEI